MNILSTAMLYFPKREFTGIFLTSWFLRLYAFRIIYCIWNIFHAIKRYIDFSYFDFINSFVFALNYNGSIKHA